MQEDLQSLQMQLVQRQLAEPGMALSPALLFGDLSAWAADESLMHLLKQVASGQGELNAGMCWQCVPVANIPGPDFRTDMVAVPLV